MSRTTLTDARVRALRPRKSAYDTRDSKLRGFGLRVLPSGRKGFFVHCQHRGERVWKIVGDAATDGCPRGTVSSHRDTRRDSGGAMMFPAKRAKDSSRPSPRPCSGVMSGSGNREPST